MLRMVSVAAAGILLAAPASAAVMQVVFTGEETSRSWLNNGTRYDDSSYEFYESGESTDYAGTALTWTFRYDTDLGTFEEWEVTEPNNKAMNQRLNYAVIHSEVDHGGDIFVHNADPVNTGSSIWTIRNVNMIPDEPDYLSEQYNAAFNTYKLTEAYPGDTTFDYFTINTTNQKSSFFTPWDFSTPFSVLLSSDDYAGGNFTGGNFLWDRGEIFYDADGNENGFDRFRTGVLFSITSLTVTSWDDGMVEPPVSPVPLPATAPLLLAALGGAWALRRRNHA